MSTPRSVRASKKAASSSLAPVTVAAAIPASPADPGVATLKVDFLHHLLCTLGRASLPSATPQERYQALAYSVRDRMLPGWMETLRQVEQRKGRVICYLSAEFLLGPHLGNNLLNLGLTATARQAMLELGLDLADLLCQEEEPGLGNGGLGRLAACYMDSLASLEMPAVGYGIRYEFGIFDQVIRDGWQVEIADKWLRYGNPWEIIRPEIVYEVGFGGCTERYTDAAGNGRVNWLPGHAVHGVACDTPIQGFRVSSCNLLRLWKAEAHNVFDFQSFNTGEYYRAVEDKIGSETLTKVLYPNDENLHGKELRLQQQYFFVSCSLQDMLAAMDRHGGAPEHFHERFAFQLNDTHPAIAVAELMRLLVDVKQLSWETAWAVTSSTFSYTNHTLLPEALEKWRVDLFGRLLPRHLEIIYEINRRFLDDVRKLHPGDEALVARLSLIEEGGGRSVRMAHLAAAGSRRINGVAELHSELLKQDVMRDFAGLWPGKFTNVTNGITPRRFLALANPELAALINCTLGGDGWLKDLDQLRRLEPYADDAAFRAAWRRVKRANKCALAAVLRDRAGVTVDPDSLFDIQAKRIHEYKRQHLNLLHIITLWRRLKADPGREMAPRTFVFAGKAAPGYYQAKRIIKLVTGVGDVVNGDPDVRGRIKVAFLPDFNVKNSQEVYPAADLSEQISTAGKEASGTGNMKFSLNGALTIGTLDGANIEIREETGVDNFFLFGLTASEVRDRLAAGYEPRRHYENDSELREVLDAIASGMFSGGDTAIFRPLVDELLSRDSFLALADYRAYIDCQDQVAEAWRDPERWDRMSILTTARMGKFSSDRAIREYAANIWNAVGA